MPVPGRFRLDLCQCQGGRDVQAGPGGLVQRFWSRLSGGVESCICKLPNCAGTICGAANSALLSRPDKALPAASASPEPGPFPYAWEMFARIGSLPLSTGRSRAGRRLLALCNPHQTIAGDDGAFGGHDHVAKGNQLCQMGRRYLGVRRCNRDLDQRGELFGRQKLWRVNGHS
jgi:hypothetical protein